MYSNPWSETLSWYGTDGTKYKKERTRTGRKKTCLLFLVMQKCREMQESTEELVARILAAAGEVRKAPGNFDAPMPYTGDALKCITARDRTLKMIVVTLMFFFLL